MTTVLAPVNQVVQPYVFRGGGCSDEKDHIENVSLNPISSIVKCSNKPPNMKTLNEGGLEMIYEETAESLNLNPSCNSVIQQNCLIGNNNDPLHITSSLSPSPSILRRSRSLPQDEFRVLGQKLGELKRNDSIGSGKSGR